ncbi:MAG TPA: hypothetical protein VN929_04835 [Burkholderiales bacterium]|nr:hypothetical protein [Burkholderiales bacterium]
MNVFTLGVIDLVEPGNRGIALHQLVARRRVGHYVGLSVDLLEEHSLEIFPRNLADVEGTDKSVALH